MPSHSQSLKRPFLRQGRNTRPATLESGIDLDLLLPHTKSGVSDYRALGLTVFISAFPSYSRECFWNTVMRNYGGDAVASIVQLPGMNFPQYQTKHSQYQHQDSRRNTRKLTDLPQNSQPFTLTVGYGSLTQRLKTQKEKSKKTEEVGFPSLYKPSCPAHCLLHTKAFRNNGHIFISRADAEHTADWQC